MSIFLDDNNCKKKVAMSITAAPQLSLLGLRPDIDYLSPKQIDVAHRRMRPEGYSQEGFIAEDEELVELCKNDAKVLAERGITHKQIGDRLEQIIAKVYALHTSRASLEDVAVIDGVVEVPPFLTAKGFQGCPFSDSLFDSCGKGSSLITIRNRSNGKQINNVTELHGHLIRDHHFFEGSTRYRLDPALAIEVLAIEPNISYEIEFHEEKIWSSSCSSTTLTEEEADKIKQRAIKEMTLFDGGLWAGILPCEYFCGEFGEESDEEYLHLLKKPSFNDLPEELELFGAHLDCGYLGHSEHSIFTITSFRSPILGRDDYMVRA